WVTSGNDGQSDTASFDPPITSPQVNGAAVDPATLDDAGLPAFVTTASTDFAFAGRPMPVFVPVDGQATISGAIVKPNITTDEVHFTITLTRAGATTTVFSRVFAPGETGTDTIEQGTPPQGLMVDLQQGDLILARIDSDTRINLSGIRFAPTLAYQTIQGSPAPRTPNGTPALQLDLPATAQIFATSNLGPGGQPTPFVAPGGSTRPSPWRGRPASPAASRPPCGPAPCWSPSRASTSPTALSRAPRPRAPPRSRPCSTCRPERRCSSPTRPPIRTRSPPSPSARRPRRAATPPPSPGGATPPAPDPSAGGTPTRGLPAIPPPHPRPRPQRPPPASPPA